MNSLNQTQVFMGLSLLIFLLVGLMSLMLWLGYQLALLVSLFLLTFNKWVGLCDHILVKSLVCG